MRARRHVLRTFTFTCAFAFTFAIAIAGSSLIAPAHALAQEGEGEGEGEEELLRINELNTAGVTAIQEKRFDEGVKAFEEMLAIAARSTLDEEEKRGIRQLAEYNLACTYSLKGDKAVALDWFDKAITDHFWDWEHIASDTDLDAIRNEARFGELIAKGKELAKAYSQEQAAELISKEPIFDYRLAFDPVNREKPVRGAELVGKVVVIDLFVDQNGRGGVGDQAALSALAAEKKDAGLEVVSLLLAVDASGALDEGAAKQAARRLVEARKLTQIVGVADQEQIQRARIEDGREIPLTLVLDRAGKLRARVFGQDRNPDTIRAIVDRLLAEAKPTEAAKKKKAVF